MKTGESVEALKRLFDGAASYTIRNVGRGLVNINAPRSAATPSIGSRMTCKDTDLVVTSVDQQCIYAAHVSGAVPQIGDETSVRHNSAESSRWLHLPKINARSGQTGRRTPWRTGNYLFDLTQKLRKGDVCSIVGETGTGKSTMASRLLSNCNVVVCAETTQKQYSNVEELVTVDPHHWGAPQHAWLAPLRGLQRALELSKEKDVTLVLDDLSLLYELHRTAERPYSSVVQIMNAISAYAGPSSNGNLSIAFVVDSAPEHELWSAVESISDVTLNADAALSRAFWPLALMPGSGLLDRVSYDLFRKLRDLVDLKEKVDVFRDLKMHVDFWETDDVDSLNTALAILKDYGNPSSTYYTKEMITLARACSIFHFPRMEPQEISSFREALFYLCHEDGLFDSDLQLDDLDRALLRYGNQLECLRPQL